MSWICLLLRNNKKSHYECTLASLVSYERFVRKITKSSWGLNLRKWNALNGRTRVKLNDGSSELNGYGLTNIKHESWNGWNDERNVQRA